MKWVHEDLGSTVLEVVSSNSGMPEELLIHDNTYYEIKNLDKAVSMIREAVVSKKEIYIAGDYDADGVCASSILYLMFSSFGYPVKVRLPRRFSEGYGLSEKMVEEFNIGSFLITVDNGITAVDAIKLAKEKGITVLLTDHHPATGELPNADLIIDPNAIENSADFNGYCGAGIAFKIAEMFLGKNHPLIDKLSTIAAIATVADVVPLTYDNRKIVKRGLEQMMLRGKTTKGLSAILSLNNLSDYISESDIGFKIAPMLNAPGRLIDDGAKKSFECIVYEGTPAKAEKLATELMELNEKRKSLSREWSLKSQDMIVNDDMMHDFPLILYLSGIPEGIVGIVAGQLAELIRVPTIVLTDDESGNLKGSARTYGDFNLKNLLKENSRFLLKYGAHPKAGGLSLTKANLYDFACACKKSCEGISRKIDENVYYNLKVKVSDYAKTLKDVLSYGPYGEGNPAPIVLIEDIPLIPDNGKYYKLLGNDTTIKLQANGFDILGFNIADSYMRLDNPRKVSVIGLLGQNSFMGNIRHQLELIDVKKSEEKDVKTSFASFLANKAKERE